MASVGRSLNLVIGQKEGINDGEINGSLVSPTSFLLYFPYKPGTVLGIRFGSNKDAYVKTQANYY